MLWRAFAALLAAAALVLAPSTPAQAYNPMGGVLYDLGDRDCLKGLGNCAVYPKAAQLPGGRLVAAFENAVVAPSGSADGETLPVYKSDDLGTSWQHLTEVPAPAYLSSDPAYDRYISHWGSPYLYALPQQVGNLSAGTLLLASIVTGDDHYFLERKAADPNWVPNNDGDRSDMALALYASNDQGASWRVVNIIATGGWQGGSAGATGVNVAAANIYRQVDPIWEPFLMVYNGQLVAYYSDENDYLGVGANGVPVIDPANATATDSHGQILVHRTWNGTGAWSAPVVDVAGLNVNMGGGKTEIGGGPGQACQEQRVGLVAGETGQAGAVAVEQLEAAGTAPRRVHRNARGPECLDVAVHRAHRHLQFGGECLRADPAAHVQQQEDRQQPARAHAAHSGPKP